MVQYTRYTDHVEFPETPEEREASTRQQEAFLDKRSRLIAVLFSLVLIVFCCFCALLYLTSLYMRPRPCDVRDVMVQGSQAELMSHVEYAALAEDEHSLRCLVEEYVLINRDNVRTGVGSTTHGVPLMGVSPTDAYLMMLRDAGRHLPEWRTPVDHFTPLEVTAVFDHVFMAQLLVRLGADVNRRADKFRTTALQVAAYYNSVQTAGLLLSQGADPSLSDRKGNTPLHSAAQQGGAELVGALIEYGARPDAANLKGDTPLHVACRNHALPAAVLLVRAGANVHALNGGGHTPLDLIHDTNFHRLLFGTDAFHNPNNVAG